MLQCFIKKKKSGGNQNPELVYISRDNVEDRIYPRISHAHEDFVELILIRDGEGIFTIDGKNYPVKKGDLVVLNSGIIHDESGGMVSSYACAVSGIKKDGLRENALIGENMNPVVETGNEFGIVDGILSQIFYLLSGDVPKAEESCQCLLDAMLMQLERVVERTKENVEEDLTERKLLAKQIKDYIDQNYMNDISLGSISDALHISLFYLSHTFKEFFGYSPIQYVLRRRIGEAQSLLIGTDLTVTRIAMIVGCDNPNHFNTIFSKNVGVTPRNYRRMYQSKENEDLSCTVM